MPRYLVGLSAGVVLLAPPALAQRDTLAALAGTVHSTYNGAPIAQVMVAVPGVRRFILTDSAGAFALPGLPPGTHRIRIVYDGRQNLEHTVTLRPGKTYRVEVLLEADAVDLDPIVVAADYADWQWGMAGFYARKKMGWGRFYTREDIERVHPGNLYELLAGQGLAWGCRGADCLAVTGPGGCFLSVYLNGASTFGELEVIDPKELDGVELYTVRTFHAPPGYAPAVTAITLTAGSIQTEPGCGAIYLWTRGFRAQFGERRTTR